MAECRAWFMTRRNYNPPGLRNFLPFLITLGLILPLASHGAETNDAGLIVTFRSAINSAAFDSANTPNISFFIQEGKPPSPFVPAGRFTATWEGNISAQLRSEFSFQVELNGQLKLEIN